jgi:hypothetical protein
MNTASFPTYSENKERNSDVICSYCEATDKELAMKLTLFTLTAASVIALATPASAQIIWNDEGGASATTTMDAPMNQRVDQGVSGNPTNETTFTGNYRTGVPGGRHQNLNFDANATLTNSDVKALQRALKTRGYYHGKIDGLWGGQTTQALLDYQGANEQPLTGTVTPGTLQDLGVRIAPGKY